MANAVTEPEGNAMSPIAVRRSSGDALGKASPASKVGRGGKVGREPVSGLPLLAGKGKTPRLW